MVKNAILKYFNITFILNWQYVCSFRSDYSPLLPSDTFDTIKTQPIYMQG